MILLVFIYLLFILVIMTKVVVEIYEIVFTASHLQVELDKDLNYFNNFIKILAVKFIVIIYVIDIVSTIKAQQTTNYKINVIFFNNL